MTDRNLRQAGMKTTLPRLKVLEVFDNHPDRHLSATDVYRLLMEQRVEIGLATVYRVLGQLTGAGVLSRIQVEPHGGLFELGSKARHDHLVCTRCGQVVESCDPAIAQQAERVARRHGFALESYNLGLYGCCAACSGRPAPAKGVFE